MNNQYPFRDFKMPQAGDIKQFTKKFRTVITAVIVILALAILGSNSVYTVNNGEEAVITRWGQYLTTVKSSGLQFKLPFADEVEVINVERVRRMEFGYTSVNGVNQDIPEEAIMLTQEENLVNADWVIQYRVSNSYNFLFKVDDPENTLHIITQSAYRRVTAAHPLDDILTNRKDDMQREILRDLQDICDKYELGIEITAVQLQDAAPPDAVRDAFLDVTRAIEDKNARINEARRYENEKLPLARGEAEAAVNEAEGYKEQRINEALGAVARYKAIEEEFSNQPDIMRTRMYLEMIREVLPKIEKVYFIDPTAGNLLEVLQLGQ